LDHQAAGHRLDRGISGIGQPKFPEIHLLEHGELGMVSAMIVAARGRQLSKPISPENDGLQTYGPRQQL
jgi:hypothetical protein